LETFPHYSHNYYTCDERKYIELRVIFRP